MTASSLILPDSEPTTAELVVPSRRGFIRGTAISLAALWVGAPTIIKAENLMQINTPANRMVWAFADGFQFRLVEKGEVSKDSLNWVDSGINASKAWDDDFLACWKKHNGTLHYELRRFAELTMPRDDWEKRRIFNNHVSHYDFRGKYGHLRIPSPKLVDPKGLPLGEQQTTTTI